jgi:hypothetical protein
MAYVQHEYHLRFAFVLHVLFRHVHTHTDRICFYESADDRDRRRVGSLEFGVDTSVHLIHINPTPPALCFLILG